MTGRGSTGSRWAQARQPLIDATKSSKTTTPTPIQAVMRRRRKKNVAPQLNAFWENQSFHNYADYALSPQFRGGMDQLKHLAREVLCALMCSEAVWWRCHRRIISDYLLADGWRVLHLMGQGRIEPAKLSSGAALASDRVIYPPE